MPLPCLFQDMGSSWKLSEDNLPHAFVYGRMVPYALWGALSWAI
jgi:hypothetical protein